MNQYSKVVTQLLPENDLSATETIYFLRLFLIGVIIMLLIYPNVLQY